MIASNAVHTSVFILKAVFWFFGLGDVFEYIDTVFGLIIAIRRYATMNNLRAALLVTSMYICYSTPATDTKQNEVFIHSSLD